MKKRMSFLAIIKELLTSKDQHGFSLAEVMVAAGMMGALSLVVVNLSQTANKTTKTMSQKIEIAELHAHVLRALQIESACTQTVTNTQLKGAPAVAVPIRTLLIPAGTFVEIDNIYGNKAAAAVGYPIVITAWEADNDADGKPDNQYGDANSAVNVKKIEVGNYQETSFVAGVSERYGKIDFKITYRKGYQASTDAVVKSTSFGQTDVVKFIKDVPVVVDDTTPADPSLKSCAADEKQFLQAACEMFDGVYSNSSIAGKSVCHNVVLYNDPDTSPQREQKYAFVVRDGLGKATPAPFAEGSAKIEAGLVVGNAGVTAPYNTELTGPGIGNAFIQNNLTVGALGTYNATTAVGADGALIQGALMVSGTAGKVKPAAAGAGDAFITSALSIGPSMLAADTVTADGDLFVQNNATVKVDLTVKNNATVQQDLTVNSDANIQNSLYVGPLAAPATPIAKANIVGAFAGVSMNVSGGSILTSSGTTTTNINKIAANGVTLDLNSAQVTSPTTVNYPIQVSKTNPTFRVSSDGEIIIYNGSGTGSGNMVTQIAATPTQAGGYRPMYINNMPTYALGGLSGAQYMEVPTKRWVLEAVYNSLSDNVDKASLLNAVSNIAAQPFDAIMMAICDNIRVRTQTTNGFATGSLSGANCQVDPLVCGDSTAQRCATHYTTNYNASGSLTVSSTAYVGGASTLNGAVTANSTLTVNGAYIYAPGGYIRAATYVRGDSYVYGGTYVQAGGTAASGLSGICGAAGCATKFGRYACSGGGVVIGIANGHLVCARVGGGASSPVGI